MATLLSFRALRPKSVDDAARVAAVPYDVVSTDEARKLAEGNPRSFLRVSRAELELPAGTDPYSSAVYERAAQNFAALRASSLVVEDEPSLYVYQLRMGGHTQTGLAYLDFSLERLWKSKTGGKWQSSHSFFPQHADDVKNSVDQATQFIRAHHENPEAARGGREQPAAEAPRTRIAA